MVSKFIISIAEQREQLTLRLQQHMGHAAFYANLQNILYQIVENYLYGDVMSSLWPIVHQVRDYGVPEDVAEDAVWQTSNEIVKTLLLSMGALKVNQVYAFQLTPMGDVVIEDLGPKMDVVHHSFNRTDDGELVVRTLRVQGTPAEQHAAFINEVRAGVERGDWYPENIRRLAGV